MVIVFWGIHPWTHPTAGRIRYLAESLAEFGGDMQVIYVNPPNQRKFPLRHRDFWREWRQAKQRPTEVHDGVIVLNIPPSPLPYTHHFLPFRMWRAAYISSKVWSSARRISKVPILVVGDPKEWVLARWWRVRSGIVIYDCADLIPAFRDAGERIARDEKNLLRFASLVTCSAQRLVDYIRSIRPDKPVFLVRNGVHWERFQSNFKVSTSLEAIPHPHIGFVGSISYWVDMNMIVEVAKQHPDYHFVLLGPLRVDVPKLPNIYLLPAVDPKEVPHYVHSFDIGIILFCDSPLTRCVNPLKLYEYLACGKPVIATPYGDYGDVEQWVYFVRTPEEFAEAIQITLSEDSPELQRQRREAARLASWKEHAKQLLAVIQTTVDLNEQLNQRKRDS